MRRKYGTESLKTSYLIYTIQYNTKFVKRHVAVASEALVPQGSGHMDGAILLATRWLR